MRHFSTSRNCLSAMRAATGILSLILTGIVYHYIPMRNISIVFSLAIIGISVCFMFIYLPLYLSSIKYTVTDSEIIKSSGVFIKFNQSIKFSSIQYSTVIKTPFSGITGINMIIFYVFGGNMRLPFLSLDDMREIMLISGSSGGESL